MQVNSLTSMPPDLCNITKFSTYSTSWHCSNENNIYQTVSHYFNYTKSKY